MRFFYKYKIENEELSNNRYRCTIPDLQLEQTGEGLGSTLLSLHKKALSNVQEKKAQNQLPEGYHRKDAKEKSHVRNVIAELEDIFWVNEILFRFGFAVPPLATKQELESLKKFIFNVKNLQEEIYIIESKVIELIRNTICLPKLRSIILVTSMKLDAFENFSLSIEQAFWSLYRGEIISTINTLFPVVEGILLNAVEFDITCSKPDIEKLFKILLERDLKTSALHGSENIRAFIEICRLLNGDHKQAKDKSYFNRHYWAHGMGEKVYTEAVMYRLILLVDLLVFIFDCFEGKNYIIQTENQEIDSRVAYYEKLQHDALSKDGNIRANFIKEHFSQEQRNFYGFNHKNYQ